MLILWFNLIYVWCLHLCPCPPCPQKKFMDNNNFAGTEWTDIDKKTWTLLKSTEHTLSFLIYQHYGLTPMYYPNPNNCRVKAFLVPTISVSIIECYLIRCLLEIRRRNRCLDSNMFATISKTIRNWDIIFDHGNAYTQKQRDQKI